MSESVSVEITDVFLVCGPLEREDWDQDEVRRQNLEFKRQSLEKALNSIGQKKMSEEDAGYFAKLGTKIADNLFVYLRNIHIR